MTRPTCGESFMAGTICSDAPGHTGAHSARCQECGGDWINDTCKCYIRCEACQTAMYYDDPSYAGKDSWYCIDCRCPERNRLNQRCIHYEDHVHTHGDHEWSSHPPLEPVTDEEIAEVFGLPLPLPKPPL